MAKRKIPTNMQPWKANINGNEYEYQSGTTADVPDEVAALIDFIDESAPKRDPKAAQRAIEGEVTQIVKDNFDGGVGYEETVWTVMLPEMSFEYVSDLNLISDSFPYNFEVGQDYTVTLDGETKTYTADLFEDGIVAIYDTSLEEVSKGNGWACYVLNNELLFASLDSSMLGTHTIKIGYPTTTTHKIGSKYIDSGSLGLEPLVIYAKITS